MFAVLDRFILFAISLKSIHISLSLLSLFTSSLFLNHFLTIYTPLYLTHISWSLSFSLFAQADKAADEEQAARVKDESSEAQRAKGARRLSEAVVSHLPKAIEAAAEGDGEAVAEGEDAAAAAADE